MLLQITLVLVIILSNVECQEEVLRCKTKSDQECDFPFTYKGNTYKNCTTDLLNNDSPNPNAWCATETDEDGVMVEEGECDLDSCEYIRKGGFNGGMIGGLIGGLTGATVGVTCGIMGYMRKNQKGCYRNNQV